MVHKPLRYIRTPRLELSYDNTFAQMREMEGEEESAEVKTTNGTF